MASQRTKVERIGIKKQRGFLYYLKGDAVWRSPMKPRTGKAERVAKTTFTRDDRFLYFVDSDGDVACAPRRTR